MLRHPLYLSICAAAVVYLGLADSRGMSAWRFAAMRLPNALGGNSAYGGGSFHHK